MVPTSLKILFIFTDCKDLASFKKTKYGTNQLLFNQYSFNRHVRRESIIYWRCTQFAVLRCRARLKTSHGTLTVLNQEHNHPVIKEARKYGSLKAFKQDQQTLKMLKSPITRNLNVLQKK